MKQWKEKDYYASEPSPGPGKPCLSNGPGTPSVCSGGIHSLTRPPHRIPKLGTSGSRLSLSAAVARHPDPRGRDARTRARAPARRHQRRGPSSDRRPSPTSASPPHSRSELLPHDPSPGSPPVPGRLRVSPRRWMCRSRGRSWNKWWPVWSAASETGTPWLAQDPAPPRQAIGTEWARRGAPESPRKVPKSYERLRLRRAGNTVQFSRGQGPGGCPESDGNFRAPPAEGCRKLDTKGSSVGNFLDLQRGACFIFSLKESFPPATPPADLITIILFLAPAAPAALWDSASPTPGTLEGETEMERGLKWPKNILWHSKILSRYIFPKRNKSRSQSDTSSHMFLDKNRKEKCNLPEW